MYYITKTKKDAEKLAREIKKRTDRDCELSKDCEAWRVSNNSISGDFFRNTAEGFGV